MAIMDASWIKTPSDYGDVCPVFVREFLAEKEIGKAVLRITSAGVYEAVLNGARVGDFIMAPGWTSYNKRLQYQQYDITDMLAQNNRLCVTVGKGWFRGRLAWENRSDIYGKEAGIIAEIALTYTDGSEERIPTDTAWQCAPGGILQSEIYDGEIYDANIVPDAWEACVITDHPKDILIPQEGEIIRETEYLNAKEIIVTPKGETVVDFGQNLTGYAIVTASGAAGDTVRISHAEVLDKEGNFYTENYRSAQSQNTYILNGSGTQTFKPHLCFQGFRYIRLDAYPGEVKPESFKAAVVHSDMKRTGYFCCSDPLVNKLYENTIWSQRGNFLDVPTDCPQRDERLGWTGDAQAFVRAASYNYDVLRFFKKWLRDMKADQFPDGSIPAVIPDVLGESGAGSAAWGDAAVICPWQMYLTYGDACVLAEQFDSMRGWVEYMRAQGENEYLWNTGEHYGDWLGMDAPSGSYKGSTDETLIATAFYAYSTSLLIKAGRVLGKDMAEYEALYGNIVKAYRDTYFKDGKLVCDTQTAHVLSLYFDLAEDKKAVCDRLVELIHQSDDHLTTGFVGTPYLLYALSQNGHTALAYTLLLQKTPPAWLFPVLQGATTIWEHWDGIKEDGTFWSSDMNSFNHYAYGAVVDWMYSVILGIDLSEEAPGFRHVMLRPVCDERLSYANGSIITKYGEIKSGWEIRSGKAYYAFDIPEGVTATVILTGIHEEVGVGHYEYEIELA